MAAGGQVRRRAGQRAAEAERLDDRRACRGPDAGPDAAAAQPRGAGTPSPRWAWCAGSRWPGLEEAARRSGRRRGLVIGALDETGPGEGRARPRRACKRQYLGCAGKVANGINTVHLAYVREHDRARADRRPAVDPRASTSRTR